ncbi:MAG: DUF1822 family protein [Leptolyngbyaceae cyanobacterium]
MTHPYSRSQPLPSLPAIPVALPSDSIQFAQQLAQQSSHPGQSQQIYRNLLAVQAVHYYCQMLGIPSDLSQCDCWNPFLRLTTNVADVSIGGVGRFECCLVAPAEVSQSSARCLVPAEVQADRVGYIVVQLEDDVDQEPEVHLLGFADQTTEAELSLDELRSLFELPEYLHQLAQTPPSITHLTQWLQQIVEAGWTAVDDLLGPQPQLQVRTTATRSTGSSCVYGKVLTLNTTKGAQSVTLITEIIDRPNQDLAIELTICPVSATDEFLPPGLDMIIVDALGDGVMQAQARKENRRIELGFHAERGDRFQLHLELDGTVITESFLV